MNEALQDAYKLFASEGYNGNISDFKTLIATNPDALNDSYRLFTSEGYNGSLNEYKSLIGIGAPMQTPAEPVKKKVDMVSSSDVTSSDLQQSTRPTEGAPTPFAKTNAFGTVGVSKPQPSTAAFTKPVAPEPESISGPVEKDMSVSREVSVRPAETMPKPLPASEIPQDDYFDKSLKLVNKELVGSNEEFVVPKLNYQFGDYGFKFEEAGAGDYVKVTAPNGKITEISLDNFIRSDEAAAAELQSFIKANRTASKAIEAKAKQMQQTKFGSDVEVESSVKSLNADIDSFKNEIDNFVKLKTQLEQQAKVFEGMDKATFDANRDAYLRFQENAKALELKKNDIVAKEEQLNARQNRLNKDIGAYTEMKAGQGTWYETTYNSLLNGIGGAIAGLARIGMSTGYGPAGLIPSESREVLMNAMMRGGAQQDFAGSITKAIGSETTTKEYIDKKKESFVGGALIGLIESTPAMLAGPASLPLLIGQGANAVYTEIDSNPDFADMPEWKKGLYATTIGVAAGALEKVGFSNAIAQRGLLNGVVARVLGKVGANVSGKAFSEFVEQEVNSLVTRGILRVGAAGLAEAETGALQEVSDIALKSLFNKIEGTEEGKGFDTPESTGEFINDVIVASLQEGIGGMVMGSVSATAKAYGENKFNKLLDSEVNLMNAIKDDGTYIDAFKADINKKVADGKMTQEQADADIASFDKMIGQMRSIPKDISPAGQREALRLLKERDELQAKIDISDPDLVTKEKARVAEIKEKLQKISEQYPIKEEAAAGAPANNRTFANIKSDEIKAELNKFKEGHESDIKFFEDGLSEAQAEFDKKSPIKKFILRRPEKSKNAEYERERLDLLNKNPEIYLQEEISYFEEAFKNENESDAKRLENESDADRKKGLEEYLQQQKEYRKSHIDYLKNLLTRVREDYAIQESSTEESVLRDEESQVGLQEMGEGNAKGQAAPQEDKAYVTAQEVNDNVAKANPDASVLLTPSGEDLSLTAVYVGKENRGKGIGTNVLNTVKSEADRVGKKIVLDATNELDSETDLERLGNFYERNGFKRVGENKFEYTPQETIVKEEVTTEAAAEEPAPASKRVVYDKEPTAEDGEFKLIGDPNNFIYRINENTGRAQVLDESNGLWSNDPMPPKMFMYNAKNNGFQKIKAASESSVQPTTPVAPEAAIPDINRTVINSLTDEQIAQLYDEIPLKLLPMAEGVSNGDAVYEAYYKARESGRYPELVAKVEETVAPATTTAEAAPAVAPVSADAKTETKEEYVNKRKSEIFKQLKEKYPTLITGDTINPMIVQPRYMSSEDIDLAQKVLDTKILELEYDAELTPKEAAPAAEAPVETDAERRFRGAVLSQTGISPEDLGKLIAVLTKANKNVKVIADKAKMVALLVEKGLSPEQANQVKGVRIGDTVYINPELATVDTPIHEFAHIWGELCKKQRPELWKRGLTLIKMSKYYKELVQRISENPELSNLYKTDAQIREEALIQAIGERGATIFDDNKLQLMWNNWLASFDNFIKKVLGLPMNTDITKMKLSEFLDIAATEVLTGKGTGVGGEMTIEKTKAANDFEVQVNAWQAQQSPTQLSKIINDGIKAKLTKAQIINILVKSGGMTVEDATNAYNDVKAGNDINVAPEPAPAAAPSPTTTTAPSLTTTTTTSPAPTPTGPKFATRIADAIESMSNGVFDNSVKQALIDNIKAARTQIRQTLTTEKAMRKELIDMLKQMRTSGKLSQAQALSLLRSFANTDIFSDAAVNRFVNTAMNTMQNAQAKQEDSRLASAAKLASKNIMRKIGMSESLTPLLKAVFSIKPSAIPNSVKAKYTALVDMMSQKGREIPLEEIGQVTAMANEVFDAIQDKFRVMSLKRLFKKFENKVFDGNNELDLDATINAMIDGDVISTEDADIMRNNADEFKAELKDDTVDPQERIDLIDGVKSQARSTDVNNLQDRMERDAARELIKMINDGGIETLTNNELANLSIILSNINNGFYTHYANTLSNAMSSYLSANDVKNTVFNTKPLVFSAVYANIVKMFTKSKSKIETMITQNPIEYLDQMLGNFGDPKVFKKLFNNVAKAYATYKSKYLAVDSRLNKAYDKVFKSHRFNIEKMTESNMKMYTYLLQLEYMSNIGVSGVNPAAAYIDATIKQLRKDMKNAEADILENIKAEFVINGQVDNDKLFNSFNAAEKNAINEIREINNGMSDMALYTSAVIRGDKSKTYANYIHHNVIEDATDLREGGLANMMMTNTNPSTKAKSLISRVNGVRALNFDAFTATRKSSKQVLIDYHLTDQVRRSKGAINTLRDMAVEEGKFKGNTQEAIQAIEDVLNKSLENVFLNAYLETTLADDISTFIQKTGYRAILARIPRVIGEFFSNVSAIIMDPISFTEGLKYSSVLMSDKGPEIMKNLNANQQTRVYPSGGLSGTFVDTDAMMSRTGKGGIGSKFSNKLSQLWNYTGKPLQNATEVIADNMISGPDKIVARPMWFGKFATEFKKITGVDPDFDKIAANDEAYMTQYKEALENATDQADVTSTRLSAADNPFKGILKNAINPKQGMTKKLFIQFNSFMTRFLIYEFNAARTAVYAMLGKGTINRTQATMLLGGIVLRMMTYQMIMNQMNSLIGKLFKDEDEEEEEKSFGDQAVQGAASALSSLALGRSFGNTTRTFVNYGVEKVNEKYFDFLRDGEYDPYTDKLVYSPIQDEKINGLDDVVIALSGPLSPTLKTAKVALRAFGEKKKEEDAIKRQELEKTRVFLETGGNAGLVPFYGDIRAVFNSYIYKDLKKKIQGMGASEGVSREFLKRYFPDQYESLYGEQGTVTQAEAPQKAAQKEIDDLIQKITDEAMGYVEPSEEEKKAKEKENREKNKAKKEAGQ